MTDRKRPIDHALDLFVYAPLGFWMNVEEVLPELIEKGHQQVQMARMFGQFAVDTGTKEVRKRVEHLVDRAPTPGRPTRPRAVPDLDPDDERIDGAASDGDGGRPATPAAVRVVATAAAPEAAPGVAGADGEPVPTPGELAITDYDSLSASQVVPRLEGLSSDERDAVRRYEAAHRGRKTILAKIAQLG